MCRRPPARRDNLPTPMPLVVLLHGCTQNALDFATGTAMNAGRERGCLVLVPSKPPAAMRSCAGTGSSPATRWWGVASRLRR
jgi:poly(3-hydroxybutyrate) depolymerase